MIEIRTKLRCPFCDGTDFIYHYLVCEDHRYVRMRIAVWLGVLPLVWILSLMGYRAIMGEHVQDSTSYYYVVVLSCLLFGIIFSFQYRPMRYMMHLDSSIRKDLFATFLVVYFTLIEKKHGEGITSAESYPYLNVSKATLLLLIRIARSYHFLQDEK